jgi:hypothetical protein
MMINKQVASRKGSPILWTLFALVAFSAQALAESRTGMTTVSVRVERHSGVLIPTSTNGFAPASYRPGADNLEQVMAFGNGTPKPVFSGEAHSKLAPAASRLSPVRTEVTVFEP